MSALPTFPVATLISANAHISAGRFHSARTVLQSRRRPHLLLQYAVKDEDEHALQGVEDGEQVGHDDRALVDVHQAEGPGQAQQTQQGYGSDHPGPEHTTKQRSAVSFLP